MNALAPKLILTPLLVASTSLAGRRWGAALSGWLIALPLTSGPIAFFIAIELGPKVATAAAAGSLLGAIGQVAFCVAYTRASARVGWRVALPVAALAFVVVGVVAPPLPAPVLFGGLLASIAAGLWATRDIPITVSTAAVAPPWDIPARVAVATLLVLGISTAAPLIGGRASGILATFPVYGAVLATFAHQLRSSADAAAVLRGLMTGLLGFGMFFLLLGLLLEATDLGIAFGAAGLAALVVQAITLPIMIRRDAAVDAQR